MDLGFGGGGCESPKIVFEEEGLWPHFCVFMIQKRLRNQSILALL